MLLADLVEVSRDVAATPRRSQKVARLAAALRAAGPGDVAVVVPWLSGDLRQRRTGIGWAALRTLPPAADSPTLHVAAVDRALQQASELAGAGSSARRQAIVADVFGAATGDEQRFLRALISGDLRQGALDGVMVDAVAAAADVPIDAVRRAVMLRGAVAPVAGAALSGGADALAEFGLVVGRPVAPMLAATATSVADAVERLAGQPVAVDWKLDGIRVQVHRDGDEVHVFTRSLDDVTARLPEIVAAARALPVRTAVLDGEALALRTDGRPRPFQETGSRSASRGAPVAVMSWFVFDVLHVDGEDLIDRPLDERHEVMRRVVPEGLRVPRVMTSSADRAAEVLEDALGHGHEGVVVKSTTGRYAAGRRGAAWLKVKPVHTLDLVVLAAEWGSGRRRGRLSNLHLGARDPNGGFVMLGKTFKGMTDEMLAWQTEQLQRLAISRTDRQVTVAPELVVEVAFDGVQASTRYPGGVTLRFARVMRYRDDKPATEADTLDTVRSYLR